MDGLTRAEDRKVNLYLATVVGVDDKEGGDRIKALIHPADKRQNYENIPYAFPLLPKIFHIKPKIGEMVLVVCEDSNPKSQRYYIGPIISQPQAAYYESSLNATSLLRGGAKPSETPASNNGETTGAFAKENEIAILGRKNSDIILGDDDVRIRSGVKLVNEQNHKNVTFNKESPAFIKIKHHPIPLEIDTLTGNTKVNSTATVVADNINLISTNGDPYFNVSDADESISDAEMKKIIESAHRLPYGDELVKFLTMFLTMFKSYTHKYHNLPPCPDPISMKFDEIYNADENSLSNNLLSKNIKIN